MKTIKLYGALGAKFGKVFKLDVKNPAEAVRAMCSQVKGFRQHLVRFSEPGYVVRVGGDDKSLDELRDPCSSNGANAVVRIIIGTALIAAGVIAGGPTNPLGFTLMTMGSSLVMGGIAEILAPSPKTTASNSRKETPSYMFDGPVNTIGSGYAVTVGYGEMLIGSHVVSAELYSVEEPI